MNETFESGFVVWLDQQLALANEMKELGFDYKCTDHSFLENYQEKVKALFTRLNWSIGNQWKLNWSLLVIEMKSFLEVSQFHCNFKGVAM